MTPPGRSAVCEVPAFATPTAGRPTCPRCDSYLRRANDDPDGLCEPCRRTVESCAPFHNSLPAEPAPEGVNVLELAAGLLLTHDALHPGEPLYLREALAAHGVCVDHIAAHKIANKLRRRHGLVLAGEPRQAGYVVSDWTYVASRLRSSLKDA